MAIHPIHLIHPREERADEQALVRGSVPMNRNLRGGGECKSALMNG